MKSLYNFSNIFLSQFTSKSYLFIYVQTSMRDCHHICIWGEVVVGIWSADTELGSKVSLRTVYTMWGEPWLSCNYKIAMSTSFIVGPHPACIWGHLCEECFQARSSCFMQLFHFQTKIKVGEAWQWGYQSSKITTFGRSYLREVLLCILSYRIVGNFRGSKFSQKSRFPSRRNFVVLIFAFSASYWPCPFIVAELTG